MHENISTIVVSNVRFTVESSHRATLFRRC